MVVGSTVTTGERGPQATAGSGETSASAVMRAAPEGGGVAGTAGSSGFEVMGTAGEAAPAGGVVAASPGVETGGVEAHGFGFAACGGLRTTSRRHDDREANTPW